MHIHYIVFYFLHISVCPYIFSQILLKTTGNLNFDIQNALTTRFTFPPEKILKLKIKRLFRQLIAYIVTHTKNIYFIVKAIHNTFVAILLE